MSLLDLLSGGKKSTASHPGRVRAETWRVVGSYPLYPVLLAIGWLLSLAAALDGFHWAGLLLLAIATLAIVAYWRSIGAWFARGDVCPGVVVGEKPLLVATLSDLSVGSGSYPAIKIRREPAGRFAGDSGVVGKRVVCIARYEGTSGSRSPVWSNFHPRAVQCATSDGAEVQRLLREIPAQRWTDLQRGVQRLPRPFRPGLYRLTSDA